MMLSLLMSQNETCFKNAGSMRMLMDGKVAPLPMAERPQPQAPSRASINKGSESTPRWPRTLRKSLDIKPRSTTEVLDRRSRPGNSIGPATAFRGEHYGWRGRCAHASSLLLLLSHVASCNSLFNLELSVHDCTLKTVES